MDPAIGSRSAALTTCSVAEADGEWTSQPFVAQAGRFRVELTATPTASPIDAVVGLSAGAADWFPDLAAIVRFNPADTIDVRAGAGYQADLSVAYSAGTAYRIRLDLDVGLHVYSVSLVDASGALTRIASNYPFRTEQAEVALLDNVATQVDSASGSLDVCDLRISTTTPGGCPVALGNGGFVDQSIGQPGEVMVISDFVATPDQVLDGVIGLSARRATSFNDLAATVRFSPDGVIDARDGDSYRSDTPLAYVGGQARRIRIIANVSTHTFSAYAQIGDHDSVQFAHGYAFRTSQAHTGFLGMFNQVVDSDTGQLAVCNARHAISVGVRMEREGNYSVVPLAGDSALISDGTITQRVDSVGRPVAQLDVGGQLAVDASGNVYIARMIGADLAMSSYTADFAFRWIHLRTIGSDHRVLAIGADAGSVVVGAGPITGGVDLVKRWFSDGTDGTVAVGPMGDAVAIGPTGYVIGSAINNTVVVNKFSFGNPLPDWTDVWHNGAHIDVMAIAPSGRVFFSGQYSGLVSFGGPTLAPANHGLDNTYAVGLTAAGAHVFTRDLHETAVRGIASNGPIVAISPNTLRLITLTTDGTQIFPEEGRTGFSLAGGGRAVAVAPSGRVFWNFVEFWPAVAGAPLYPFLIALEPGV